MDKLISNFDLVNFIKIHNLDHIPIYKAAEVTEFESLFEGENVYVILFEENEGSDVGHWTLLIKLADGDDELNGYFEYFDCLGRPPPDNFNEIMERDQYFIQFLRRPVMEDTQMLCGKYVISRILSVDTPLEDYVKILTGNKHFSPDEIIDMMYRIQY